MKQLITVLPIKGKKQKQKAFIDLPKYCVITASQIKGTKLEFNPYYHYLDFHQLLFNREACSFYLSI